MATGILINGAFQQISFLKETVGPVLTVLLVLALFALYAGYGRDLVLGRWVVRHARDPLGSFALGTWVAAASVTGIAIVHELPFLHSLAVGLAYVAFLLWLGYLWIVVRNYAVLFHEIETRRWEVTRRAQGVLLLATVATQSVIVAFSVILPGKLPGKVGLAILLWGVACYVIGFALIVGRMLFLGRGSLADDWPPTNCILHGAMSITGLAAAVGQLLPINLVDILWLWCLLGFLVVEGIEIVRAVECVTRFGWRKGLFSYATPQWSRNFTFGMFLAFTMHVPSSAGFIVGLPGIVETHLLILHFGWILVVGLFIAEVGVGLNHLVTKRLTFSKGDKTSLAG